MALKKAIAFNSLFDVGTVDPQLHIIMFGPVPITDWVKLKLDMVDSDRIVAIKGANGRTDRKVKGNPDWIADITVQHTSSLNHILSLSYTLDVGVLNQGPIPFIIADLNGNTIFASIGAWIKGLPGYSIDSSGAEGRTWRIYCLGYPSDVGTSFL